MPEIKEQFTYLLDDKFLMEDLKDRKLYINYEIDETIIDEIIYHILKYNAEDKDKSVEIRKPILLYISSPGGSIDAGMALVDVILASKTPIYTINISYNYSMAFIIHLAGHKRFTMKNSTFLMHDGQNFIYDSSNKLKDRMRFCDEQEERVKKYILSQSRLTEKEYDEKLRIEWYMYPELAKEKGFTHYIVGVDCGIDEIV